MQQRILSILFPHLTTDWTVRRRPELRGVPFVLAAPERGKMVVKAASPGTAGKGIHTGMAVADCRAILPGLQVLDDEPQRAELLLSALAEWCLRFTPVAGTDLPDGLLLDITGCAHLWGGEAPYLKDIVTRLKNYGYDVRAAIADTIGAAWAISRFGKPVSITGTGAQTEALLALPPAALRLEAATVQRLEKLGLYQLHNIILIPRSSLRRRFGQAMLSRLDQALGQEKELVKPIHPAELYLERLPSPEPIRTAKGIEIALGKLLETLCQRLVKEGKGLRTCIFKCYRIDGNIQQITAGTNRPSRNAAHLFRLLEIKICQITPALGIELFVLEAPLVEDVTIEQETLWNNAASHDDTDIAELLDRLAGKVGAQTIRRYLPDEHYWPERSIRLAGSLHEKATTAWRPELPRPLLLLPEPEPIEVTVPIPDYPPMLFIYKGVLHNVSKADGPERIEEEWWLEDGLHRDYYCVEDKKGARYWLFRLGHYGSGEPKWFIHGFFA